MLGVRSGTERLERGNVNPCRRHARVRTFPVQLGPNQTEKASRLFKFNSREQVDIHSHEAVDGLQVVPRAKQEKREANDDEEAAQVDEGVLREEPPETGPPVVDGDVLALGEKARKHVDIRKDMIRRAGGGGRGGGT